MTSTEILLKYVASKCRTEKLISWSLSQLPSSKRGPPGTGSQLVAGLTCRNDSHAQACSIHVLRACRHTVPGKCAVRMARRGSLEHGAITCALAQLYTQHMNTWAKWQTRNLKFWKCISKRDRPFTLCYTCWLLSTSSQSYSCHEILSLLPLIFIYIAITILL